jgi:hypothetical protein
MPKIQTSGICRACQERLSEQVIGRHLASCPKRPSGTFPVFDLRVFAGPYWLYLEASAKATLEDLDELLRYTWVECCEHLSAFDIAGTRHQADTGGMRVPLGRVLRPRLKFTYEYDFGTTTELEIKVLSERQGPSGKRTISILARNDPPKFPCSACQKPEPSPAKMICTECQTDMCGACAKKHECDEEQRLPLVNSPRAGVCGYTGSTEDEEAAE